METVTATEVKKEKLNMLATMQVKINSLRAKLFGKNESELEIVKQAHVGIQNVKAQTVDERSAQLMALVYNMKLQELIKHRD